METAELSEEAAAALASLVAIGGKSGDTVVGLSGVRRVRELAYVFVDGGIAANTLRELERMRRGGTEVFRVASLKRLTGISISYRPFDFSGRDLRDQPC